MTLGVTRTTGPEAEFSFDSLLDSILTNRLPVWSPETPASDESEHFVIPLVWLDTPEPLPIVILEVHPDRTSVHCFGPPIPKYTARRLNRRLELLVRSLHRGAPPPDFMPLDPGDFLEYIRAYQEATRLRHPLA